MQKKVDIEKEIVYELTFLNREVTRTKEKLDAISKEVSDLEVAKTSAEKQLKGMVFQDNLKIDQLNEQIEKKELFLSSLIQKIESSNATLIERFKEEKIASDNLANLEEKYKKEDQGMDDKRSSLTFLSVNLRKREKEIIEKERLSKDISLGLKTKEDYIVNTMKTLEEESEEVKNMKDSFVQKIDKANDTIRTYDSKIKSLEHREDQVLHTQRFIKSEELRLNNVEEFIKTIEKKCVESKLALQRKEVRIENLNENSIKREQTVMLRESECRLREKKISIALQENNLKD